MKNTLLTSIFALATTSLFAQNGPIDFEPNGFGASWVWTIFENDTQPPLEIVANPDPTGINTSATVAKYTALQSGAAWAGCETVHGAGTGSFFIDASNAIVRIMVWKSVVSDVGLKLVRPDGWSLGEIKISNTLTNQWEQLTYDFSAHIGLTPAYDQLVVFPDFQTRSSDNIIYFDNIFGPAAGSSASIDELSSLSTRIFPNPANDRFGVESTQLIQKLKILDITGRLVHEEIVQSHSTSVDISTLPKGLYLVVSELENGPETQRLIKK